MDHADRGSNEYLLSSVNELVQRRYAPSTIYHGPSPPIFQVKRAQAIHSITTDPISSHLVLSKKRGTYRAASKAKCRAPASIWTTCCCQSRGLVFILFLGEIETEMEVRTRQLFFSPLNSWQSFPSLTHPSVYKAYAESHRPSHDWCASPFGTEFCW